MNEDLIKYYQYLQEAGADVPDTFESFHSTLQDEKKARTFYDYLNENKFDAPKSFDSFSETLGLKKKSAPLAPGVPGPEEQRLVSPADFPASAPSPEHQILTKEANQQILADAPVQMGLFDQKQSTPEMVHAPLDRPSELQLPPVLEKNPETGMTLHDENKLKEGLIDGKPMSLMEHLDSFGGHFNKSITQMVSSFPKGGAILRKGLDELIHGDSKPVQAYDMYKLGAWIDKKALEAGITATDPRTQGDFLEETVPSAIGSAMSFIMTGGAGASGKVGQQLLTGSVKGGAVGAATKELGEMLMTKGAAASGNLMGIQEFEAAKAAGSSDEEALQVYFKNYGVGQTEVIPLSRAFDRINKFTGGKIIEVLKASTTGSIEEASQEAIQQWLTNEVARGTYDPGRAPFKDMIQSMGAGAFVGFILPGIGAAMQSMTPQQREQTKQILHDELKAYGEQLGQQQKEASIPAPEETIKPPEGDLKTEQPPVEAKPVAEAKPEKPAAVPEEVKPKKEKKTAPKKPEPAKEEDDHTFEDKKGKKYKIIGENADGDIVGEDDKGVRAIATGKEGNIIVTQPVGLAPKKEGGIEIQVNRPEGEFMTRQEIHKANVDAQPSTKAGHRPNDSGVYVSDDIEEIALKDKKRPNAVPFGEIKVVQLDNDKWIGGSGAFLKAEGMPGYGEPLGMGEEFDTREEAISAQAKRIKKFADTNGDERVSKWAAQYIKDDPAGPAPLTNQGKAGDFIENDKGDVYRISSVIPLASETVYTIKDKEGKVYTLNPTMGEFTMSDKNFEAPAQTGEEKDVVGKISDLIGKEKLTKREIEAIGKEHGIEDKNQIKELSELAVVQKARELAKANDFEGIVKLYNDQPNLTHRTNESIEKQQYSTPAPIAYLGGKYVNAEANESNFEPSAGNGMLTIVGTPGSYTVNEIDETRLKNLNTQGFKKVLTQSGAEEFNTPKTHDAVITNPPFGGTSAVKIDNVKFNELAQIMAVRGLNTMKDNGKAFIIIGGNNKFDSEGRLTGRDRIFFNYLYNRYNVDDVIDVSGDLYRKQGASFPIRVILVNGRKATQEGFAPLEDQFLEQVTSFEELRDRIEGHQTAKNEDIQPAELVGKPADATDSGSTGQGGTTVEPGTPAVSESKVSESNSGSDQGGAVEEPATVGKRPAGNRGAKSGPGVDSGSNPVEQPVSEQTEEQGRPAGPESNQPGGVEEELPGSRARGPRKIAEGDGGRATVEYKPLSQGKSLELQSPSGMRQEVLDAQTSLENDVGDIDEYVRKKLGYKSNDEMFKALGAEQIDGVALAIRNIERGTGIIIGDQTGVGKGRQAAAIVRYGVKRGLKPIFLTEKPNLFSDLYRDLAAIGSADFVPFIVNSKGEKFNGISNEQGTLLHKAPSMGDKEHKAMLAEARVPDDADFILATYSQFSSPKYVDKIRFLQNMAQGNVVILDESHNASGEGNTSTLFQELLPTTQGVVYLSGTFAKRADNMPVYALKTSMREANLTIDQLVAAVEAGGAPLQEIISSQLAESGEMIRRERTFDGIEVKFDMSGGDSKEVKEKQLKQANQVTEIMNDIIKFQRDEVVPVIKAKDASAKLEGKQMGLTKGTNMAGVDNTPYFSKVFNVINQLLYALKARDTADFAIAEIKAGRKPFVAIRSTMESMLKDLVERGDVKIGDALDPDFRFVLKKGLEGVMKMTVTDPYGEKEHIKILPEELFGSGEKEFKRIMAKIGSLKTGLTISPIDEFVQAMEEAGYKVGEVTGRQMKVIFKGDKAILENNKKQPVNELYRKYNNGDIDVLIVNSSGSTGASAHSDKNFKDQRQRSMIVLEPELNVSTLVQLLGRVNRTNQVNKPVYTFKSSHIPAEQRLMMMTMRKLKSLSANTTSNQKQSSSIINVPEIFNKYGDQVVIEYLQENPELIEALGNPLDSNEDGTDAKLVGSPGGAASKVTGRVAILPTDKQASFYSDISDSYEKQLQFLNDAGMNDLEISSLPLRAKTTTKKTKIVGTGGKTKFGDDTYMEEVEADVLKKPMTKSEIDKAITDLTGDKPELGEEYRTRLEKYSEKVLGDLRATVEAKINKQYEAQMQSDEPPTESVDNLIEQSYRPKAEREESKIRYVDSLLKFFTPGRAVRVPTEFGENGGRGSFSASPAIFLGFDVNEKSDKPFLPSKIVLKFALNDSRRFLSIPASKMDVVNTIRQQSYDMDSDLSQRIRTDWDKLKKPKARGKRYIITGNVLQGLGDVELRGNGQIVKYTTEDGHVETGILMKEQYDPGKEGVNKSVTVPASKAYKSISTAEVGKSFKSNDTIWTITRKSGNKFMLRLPRSKATGGKYYLDGQINDLVDNGRWDSVGTEMEAFTDATRLEQLLHLLTSKFRTAFTIESKNIDELVAEASKRSAETFEEFKGTMSSFLPIKVSGKVKKAPTNKALLAHINKKNLSEAELEAQLAEEIKFTPEVEKRFSEAAGSSKENMAGLATHVKEFLHGFSSHFKYLSEKKFPREANILREFEGLKKWANAESNIYVKGLVEPLTEQQYKILSRRIILADMLASINKGLNMSGLDGKLPFGFADKVEVEKELKKFEDFSQADPALETAFEKRNIFMQAFKDQMINSGLLSENDIDDYYHRRVLAYQSDDMNKSILFGKDIADKKRDFQRMRRGTRGLDYSTNFIESEYKVVAEGLYELEKQRVLKDLMSPYEKALQSMKAQFNKEFDSQIEQLEKQYGKTSLEVDVKKSAKQALMRAYLEEHLPEGYTFYRVSDDNRLFWAKTVTQQVLDKAVQGAQVQDNTGAGTSMDIIDALIGDLSMGLMVGAKRKQYMVPKQLAEQLEEMAKNESVNPPEAIIRRITDEWKKLVLLSPNRLLRYSLNNFGGDIDRTLQVEPKILARVPDAFGELWDFHKTGKVTPELLEAMRGGVIDSGFEISELASLSKQQWVTYFLDMKNGPSIEDIFKEKWTKDMMLQLSNKPGKLYDRYIEWASKYTRLRENTLRYAAYKLAVDKVGEGKAFYWASKKNAIDSIKDPRQLAAKLAREVYGDYGNISYTGQWLRRHLLPFYSWTEINMGTHVQLIKNASSPAVQRAMIRSALGRGIPYVTARMAYAYAKLFMFTAAVEAWNHFIFPALPWVDDEDKDAAERLRRAHVKGMQVLFYVDEEGKVHGLPIIGAFYDFIDFFGIPGAVDDIERIFTGNNPVQDAVRAGKGMGAQTAGRLFQMTTPAIKMPLEFVTNQTYYPDARNPIPIHDRGEWFFNALTLKDEYNYFLTDKPQRQSYLERKWSNSLLMREFDPEMLAYYQSKRIIADYTGKKDGSVTPTNPHDEAKQKALNYYTLAMRYGNLDEAVNQLITYYMNGGTPESIQARLRNADPLGGLGKRPKPGEPTSEFQDIRNALAIGEDYEPMTSFGKSLTSDEMLVMKDAVSYYLRMQGLK